MDSLSERYNTTLGFYEPSVFHIFLRGKGKLGEMATWNTQQASTFLHEYVHFLQDISSVKGLQNMYIIGEYLRYVTQEVNRCNYQIKLPIDPFSAGYNVGANWYVSFYTQGTTGEVSKFNSYKPDHPIIVKDSVNGKTISIERILMDCQCADGNVKQEYFGSIQIMEGMAKMVQESVYPTPTRTSPYNPYYIAVDVANSIITDLGKNRLTMIAIFDYALQSSNPGWAFVKYIEGKKKQGFDAVTLTYQVVYSDFQNAKVKDNNIGVTSFITGYENLMNMAKGVFKDYTGGLWMFKNIENWYDEELRLGEIIRTKCSQLFVDLAQGGDIRKEGLFKQLLTTFGTPIVTNSAHDYQFMRPASVGVFKEDLMNVYAMMQVHQVFCSGGVFTCPLRKYCQSMPCGIRKQNVDVRCVKAPWKRMRRFNRCLFIIWWKFKGFKDVQFV